MYPLLQRSLGDPKIVCAGDRWLRISPNQWMDTAGKIAYALCSGVELRVVYMQACTAFALLSFCLHLLPIRLLAPSTGVSHCMRSLRFTCGRVFTLGMAIWTGNRNARCSLDENVFLLICVRCTRSAFIRKKKSRNHVTQRQGARSYIFQQIKIENDYSSDLF